MDEVFAELAEKEQGEFTAIERKYYGYRGSIVPVSYYNLKVPYRGHTIITDFELGNHNLATVTMQLLPEEVLPEFLVNCRSHYYRLFYRKSDILKVECAEPDFKQYLQATLNSCNLEQLARENLFQPEISVQPDESGGLVLETKFHLAFYNKKDVLAAMVNFYKEIVDKINKKGSQ